MSFKTGTPWLAAWAPGVPKTPEPVGTGVPFPAGSMVIMQVHYNLLRGDKPVRVKLKLGLVPGSTPLKPLQLDLMPAPPDIPCPAGVTGPLCNRNAELASLAKRTGASQVAFVGLLETICGRNPVEPTGGGLHILHLADGRRPGDPSGGQPTCTSRSGHADRARPWDTTGSDPPQRDQLQLQRPGARTRSRRRSSPSPVTPSSVTCTYDPTLAQELPQLRKLPPHFVTWGDGSSDEMCLALIQSIKAPAGAQPSTSTAPVQTIQI